ncbi:Dyp-type peroxidase [Streptomyces sp. NEAU-H3]|uniref:Dyp-type peroxidase n=1 Tax=Streptomyces sp. NEAU-H3 TaxID=2720636 RepID=UPI0035B5F0B0
MAGGETAALDQHVWVPEKDGPAWLAGGSYLVARRIRMNIEVWDRTSLREQEDVFGRTKRTGAPAGKLAEHDPVSPRAMLPTAHVRLARPAAHGGHRILRRGYSFTDGTDGLGRLDAGLFFLAYQRDPRTGFIPVQRELARHDALNEYIQHAGSALFAIPPGVRDPRTGFIPVQRELARHDALNEYIQHVGSALFAIPPGVRDAHDWWGRALFTAPAKD